MSRDLPDDLVTAIDQPVVNPFLALFIALPDPVWAWTGVGTLQFENADGDVQTWIGAGGLGAIDAIGETTDGSATGLRVTLNEVPSEFRDDIAQQATKYARFEIYLGALNETFQAVESVKLVWKGRVDTYVVTDGGETLSVQITAESRGIDQRRAAIKRFSDEYQQRKSPGDKFFQYLPQMAEISILWAQAEQASTSGVGGSALGGIDWGGGSGRQLV